MKSLSSILILSLVVRAAVAQNFGWQPTSGPTGGTVIASAINHVNGCIFIALEGQGVFISKDYGASWGAASTGLTQKSVRALVINAGGDIFAATSRGVFRSTNYGESWTLVNTGLTNLDVRSLAINLNDEALFAGTPAGAIFYSNNRGDTWTKLTASLKTTNTVQALAIDQATGKIFAGTDSSGVLSSLDNGNTWAPVDTNLTHNNISALMVSSASELFVGGDSLGKKYGIFKFVGAGGKLTRVLAAPAKVLSFASKSSGQIFAGTAGSGIYLSTDGGAKWTQTNSGLYNLTIYTLAINTNGEIFAGTYCTGVFRSANNGAYWLPSNTGLNFTRILSVAFNPTNGYVFAGTDCGGVFRSIDNGASWTWVGLQNARITALAVLPNGSVLAGTAEFLFVETQGDIFRSTDNGVSWSRVTPDNDAYFSFAVHSNGDVYAGTGFYQVCGIVCVSDYGDIYRSTNNGRNWTRVASKLDDFVYALTVSPDGTVYAGTGEGIYRSRGEFWDKVRLGDVRSLVVQPTTGYIYAGMTGAIHRASADGLNWGIVRNQSGNTVWTLAVKANGELYAGTQNSGVLRSSDDGITWSALNIGLTHNTIRAFAHSQTQAKIFAGSYGQSVFLGDIVSGIETNEENHIPSSFVLEQNYPNPFNPATTIAYTIPAQAKSKVRVSLRLFDLQGRLVRTLVDEEKAPGHHRVVWNGRNESGERLASGVYLYTLIAGEFKASRKLSLLK